MKLKLRARKKPTSSGPLNYHTSILPILVLTMTAILGLSYLFLAKATTPNISLEPENGTPSGNASIITDTTASSGKAVLFKAPVVVPPTGGGTSPSWNPHVACKAVVTTLTAVLGTQKGPSGGATYAGGAFKPGVPDRRSTAQPCVVNGQPVFVEIHKVMTGACLHIGKDGDWSCGLRDPSTLPPPNGDPMKGMHIEIDGNMRAKGWGPTYPPGNKLIDVQGFVFWDANHTNLPGHFYSGWELHSFTAWRLSQ